MCYCLYWYFLLCLFISDNASQHALTSEMFISSTTVVSMLYKYVATTINELFYDEKELVRCLSHRHTVQTSNDLLWETWSIDSPQSLFHYPKKAGTIRCDGRLFKCLDQSVDRETCAGLLFNIATLTFKIQRQKCNTSIRGDAEHRIQYKSQIMIAGFQGTDIQYLDFAVYATRSIHLYLFPRDVLNALPVIILLRK